MFAKVVVNIKAQNLNESFDYKIPEELIDFVFVGSRVIVSFGFQDVLGYVIEISSDSIFKDNIKPIKEVLDYDKELTDEQVELAKYLSNSLHVPLVNTLDLMMPSFLKSKKRKYLYTSDLSKLDPRLVSLFNNKKKVLITDEILKHKDLIKDAIKTNQISVEYDVYSYGKSKKLRTYEVIDSGKQKSDVRNRIIDYLQKYPGASLDEVLISCDCSKEIIRTMVKEKIIKEKLIPALDINDSEITLKKKLDFTIDQSQLYYKFYETKNKPYLLFADSEEFMFDFYLQLIYDYSTKNKQVVIVAPTILIVEELSLYIKKNISGIKLYTFHSKNSKNDNYDTFMNVKYQNFDLLITTPMGIFLPFTNLGLIIVVDEDNPFYIYENFPYYDAKEVLKKRAESLDAKLILASKTPSIKSYYKALLNQYYLLEDHKVQNNNVITVDMRKELLEEQNIILSSILIDNIRTALKENKISMLIVNNKAFSTLIKCRDCGEVFTCSKCKVPLTLYKSKNVARCSYCGHQDDSFHTCHKCNSENIVSYGFGLEKVYHKVSMEFPQARIIQVDADNIKTLEDYNNTISAIEENTVDIIIGTNALTKKVNYDNIKVVCFLYIDSYLYANDFRGAEYTYNLIGKMTGKEVCIIQTNNVNHYAIQSALKNDYDNFYNLEIANRKLLNYEPYTEMNRIIITGPYDKLFHFAYYYRKALRHLIGIENILGPTYDFKEQGVKLIIKHNNFDGVVKVLDDAIKNFNEPRLNISFQRYPKVM
ncbi:MAG TPA: primosomal protein N' [Acholeplasmataceae bacterium]|nr:primosomal protein N' [Acholeplasmataceae bacterium]